MVDTWRRLAAGRGFEGCREGQPRVTHLNQSGWLLQQTPTGAATAQDLRITAALLGVWFVVTFVATFFARDLSFSFFGWPFGFWMAAQGALLVYLGLIGLYAFAMNQLDRTHGSAENDDG